MSEKLLRLLVAKPKPSVGFVMCAIGQQHIDEAIDAAHSVKRHMDVPIDITTNQDGAEALLKCQKDLFDKVLILNHYKSYDINVRTNRFAKIMCMVQSRFSKTIFLDTDILILDSIKDIFDSLEIFDILACHAPVRSNSPDGDYLSRDVRARPHVAILSKKLKHLFCEVNAGLLGFAKNKRSDRFLKCWERRYYEQFLYFDSHPSETSYYYDQGSLRLALLETRPRLYILPPEYNLRTVMPYFIGGNSRAMALHGRGESVQIALNSVNRYTSVRVGLPTAGLVI